LIATGGYPIKPIFPGISFKNVFTLRDSADQEKIKSAASSAKKVVIIGSGFIGIELASHLKLAKKEEVEIHIVSSSKIVYEKALGYEVGETIQKLCEANGIQFNMSASVK